MKELFRNETSIEGIKFYLMFIYKKICESKLEYAIKILMCLSIFVLIWFVDFTIGEKVFCVFMAILGVLDIIKLNVKRVKNIKKMEYIFFANIIEVSNGVEKMRLKYMDIKEIMMTKKYYYITTKDYYIFALDLKGFKIGNGKELINFIISRAEE